MLRSTVIPVFFLLACGASHNGGSDGWAGGGGQGAIGNDTGGTGASAGAGHTGGTGGHPSGTGGTSSSAGSAGAPSAGGFGGATSMHLISRNVPAYDSNNQQPNPYEGPNLANDDSGVTGWTSHVVPAWLAYDLSSAPVEQRQTIHVCWFANNMVYLSDPQPWQKMPIDYLIESNSASGGGTPPTDGWTALKSVTGNNRGAVELELDLAGANWLRMRITKGSDPTGALQVDMDVYSAPRGGADSWLFMGDSITAMGLMRGFSNLPKMVQDQVPARWPFVVDAAIGGTGAITAVNAIDETIAGYPGKYVALAYGTNDHPDGFGANMETLVKKLIAAGKVPVIPHVPWADSKLTEGPLENAAIDALYVKYPVILKGPDFWAVFENRTDLIPPGDVHPNDAGRAVLQSEWAKTLLSVQ